MSTIAIESASYLAGSTGIQRMLIVRYEFRREVLMKRPAMSIANMLTTAGLLFAGYIFITSLPDLRRYIRISTM